MRPRFNMPNLLSLIGIAAIAVISTIASDAMQRKEIKDEVTKQLSGNESNDGVKTVEF